MTYSNSCPRYEPTFAASAIVGPRAEELVLTMFVTPREGFQTRSPNPETPARIALPSPIGPRRLIDGALYDPASGDTLFAGEIEIDDV